MVIEIIASIATATAVLLSKNIVDILKNWFDRKKHNEEIVIKLNKDGSEIGDLKLELESLIERLKELEASKEIEIKNIDREHFKIRIEKIAESSHELDFIIEKISKKKKDATKTIIKDLEQIQENEIAEDWNSNKFKELIDKLDKSNLSIEEQKYLKQELERKDVTTKHKLKFVIPLLFIKYEGEIELSDKKLPRNWKEWKELFLKEK